MRRITIWAMSTISTLVLLFSYHTSTDSGSGTAVVAASTDTGATTDPTATAGASSTPTPSASSGSGEATTQAAAPSATPTPTQEAQSGADGTYTGSAIQTRYGPVQVQITVSGGQVTESVVTQVPWNDRKDQEINARAVPILNSEAVAAQSSSIDMVSGATYTSQAYIQSLQSALDQAHL